MTKHWYAVYTKTQQEQKVGTALAKKGIENYVPLTRVDVYRGFGRKMNLQPLLPGFVFVCINETQFGTVRNNSDVINFMYWLGKPAQLPAAEIQALQQFAATHQRLVAEKTAIQRNVHPMPVEKKFGEYFDPVAGLQRGTVSLQLPSLGYKLTAATVKTAGVPDYTYETIRVL